MLVALIIGFLTVVAAVFGVLWVREQKSASELGRSLAEMRACHSAAYNRTVELEKTLAEATSERAEAQKRLNEAQKDLARVERNLKNLCHGFGVPVKREYSDGDLAAFGRKAKLRAQLGPEINYIFRTAAKRGMV